MPSAARMPAFDYLKKLQDNNVGPSSSTGKLTALVNKGEIYVANGDLQMNMAQMADNPNIRIFWPAGPDGKTLDLRAALLHRAGEGRAARRQRQEADRLPADQGGAEHDRLGRAAACRCAWTSKPTDDADQGDPRDDGGRRGLDAGLERGAQRPGGRRRTLARRRPAADVGRRRCGGRGGRPRPPICRTRTGSSIALRGRDGRLSRHGRPAVPSA